MQNWIGPDLNYVKKGIQNADSSCLDMAQLGIIFFFFAFHLASPLPRNSLREPTDLSQAVGGRII